MFDFLIVIHNLHSKLLTTVHKFASISDMMYKRTLSEIIPKTFKNGFITLIYGARRVGKTVLLDQIKDAIKNEDVLFLNGDTQEARNALNTASEVSLSNLVKNHSTIFIDEAQRIPNISLSLKIIIDAFPEKKIIVTGSSSLDLARGAREQLTGRHLTYVLFPLSTAELGADLEDFKKSALLESQLVFGGYPHVYALALPQERARYLSDIAEDYLLKDTLELARLEHPEHLKKLATLLAFQIGSEVSLNELASSLGASVKTITRYLSLLEKSFIIFQVGSYATNMRKELGKGKKKYYFYDLGIRNALIGQFQPLSERADIGALWENFIMIERVKKHAYAQSAASVHFWRNYAGAEIDLIEIENGKISSALECKWSPSRPRTPQSFKDHYGVEAKQINRENYLDFVL